ncbi:hypothetical protein ACIRVK_41380 [Streptomyces sp. NPDC101152]|uniref:hypothetical protein n=1 Tax=Streptomyces sp. NPDC101152 TaxID=3366116 RepID=UPI003818BA9C
MRHWRQLVIDTWGALAYKPAFQSAADGRPTRLPGPMAASWLPDSERRRLAACTVLAAYDHNQAAALLGEGGDDRREYGDASLIVDQTLSHLLGESQKIVVEGAEDGIVGAMEREALLREWAQSAAGPSSTSPSRNPAPAPREQQPRVHDQQRPEAPRRHRRAHRPEPHRGLPRPPRRIGHERPRRPVHAAVRGHRRAPGRPWPS